MEIFEVFRPFSCDLVEAPVSSCASPPGRARRSGRRPRRAPARRAPPRRRRPRPVRRAIWSALTGASAITACTGARRESKRLGCGRRAGASPSTASASPETGDRHRAQTQQVIRPARERGCDLARDREHLATLVERQVGGDQRAAALARLDDERRLRQARRRSGCAPGSARARLDAGCVLGDDRACRRDRAASDA